MSKDGSARGEPTFISGNENDEIARMQMLCRANVSRVDIGLCGVNCLYFCDVYAGLRIQSRTPTRASG
jgi:hypothetical protein